MQARSLPDGTHTQLHVLVCGCNHLLPALLKKTFREPCGIQNTLTLKYLRHQHASACVLHAQERRKEWLQERQAQKAGRSKEKGGQKGGPKGKGGKGKASGGGAKKGGKR